MSLSGLAQLHLELTNRCDKPTRCAFCGHQQSAINPIHYGDMHADLLMDLSRELSPYPGIVVAFHRDGEPTAYGPLGWALDLFAVHPTSLVTHGLNLMRKASEIIDRCTTVTISAFKGDPNGLEQLHVLKDFLALKGPRPPQVQIKIVGDWPDHPYHLPGVRVLHRLIHRPTDNHHYAHTGPTVPEIGVCLDALHRPSIAWDGSMFLCNRLDPTRATYLGNVADASMAEIWNGPVRERMVRAHRRGSRERANPLCATCTYWGVPSQWPYISTADLIQIPR